MPLVEIGTQDYTEVHHIDPPGVGGACHKYQVKIKNGEEYDVVAMASFQEGPVKEAGVNGCHNEDLLAIVMHRLQGFQSGEYRCRENAIAITKIEEALDALRERTTAREQRGVEGTHIV